MEYFDCYASSYSRARAKFLKAAQAAGGTVKSVVHPQKTTPDGEPLAIDVACFGDRKAARQALFISGTHGQEGFSGSAVQIGWMGDGGPAKLSKDIDFPITLLTEMIAKGPTELFDLDTIDKIGRWHIDLDGYINLPPSPTNIATGCHNAFSALILASGQGVSP